MIWQKKCLTALWLFDKCNEFEKIHQQEKAALEVKLADGLEREEKNQSDMQNLKERLEMMMIAFITFKSSLVPFLEGL